ncbi:MAG: AMP-binding protein [Burkholderiales bacterium]
MGYTSHVDTFVRDHLPPREQWPEFVFERPEFVYPERLNCATELLDRMVAGSGGLAAADRPALHGTLNGRPCTWTYRQLLAQANRIAHVLTEELGLVPGNRVLLRAPNNPMLAACWLAVMKAGGVAVSTMPLLRTRELAQIIGKARIGLALCDIRLVAELEAAAAQGPHLKRVVCFNDDGPASLEAMAAGKPSAFANVDTAADDPALIAFTSGTTGPPKAAVHFHRGVMVMCDGVPRSVVQADENDVFCGTPPLAFGFGLAVLLCAPLRFGASAVLCEKLTPAGLLQTIRDYRCTITATVPTFLSQMAALAGDYDLSSLKKAISSGEALPDATRREFRRATGLELIDGFGATEMLQTFIAHAPERARPGAAGYVIPGYHARVVDDRGEPCAPGVVGHLSVKGPSGCLYLDDVRQRDYVRNGWNVTGDAFSVDKDGYFYFQGRADDMIVSAGYNIGGLEVESTLLGHEAVAECAVVGLPDARRGNVVSAFVVLKPGYPADDDTAKALQDFVKATIAPYKYPRRVEFVAALPRGETGKLLRFRLREASTAPGPAASPDLRCAAPASREH